MVDKAAGTRVEVAGRTLKLSSLDKVLYPATETTKGEVLHYYARMAPLMLPYLQQRPVTRVRWPHGVAGQSFFEKNLPPGAPSWLSHVTYDTVTYPLVRDVADLTYLVNLNSVEFHVPQWRVAEDQSRANPDRLVIDLDPGKPAGLTECCIVALHVRDRLGELGMELFPVTSGSKGMQLYAALGGDLSSDAVRDLVAQLAQELTSRFPELIVWKMAKALRPGKIFLDWSQNVAAKTTVCPYSMRGTELPNVAMPRSWDEIDAAANGKGVIEQVLFDDALDRVERDGDLLSGLLA